MSLAPDRLYVPTLAPVLAWLRTRTYLTDLVATDSNAVPAISEVTPAGFARTPPDLPWIVGLAVVETPLPGGGPNVTSALLQFDLYGKTRAAVEAAAAALVSEAESLLSGTALDSTLVAHGAVVKRNQGYGPVEWLPDPRNPLPRRSVDIEFTVYAAPGG